MPGGTIPHSGGERGHGLPPQHWRCLRTNNPLERLMREIRRRTRVVGAFPGLEKLGVAFALFKSKYSRFEVFLNSFSSQPLTL